MGEIDPTKFEAKCPRGRTLIVMAIELKKAPEHRAQDLTRRWAVGPANFVSSVSSKILAFIRIYLHTNKR